MTIQIPTHNNEFLQAIRPDGGGYHTARIVHSDGLQPCAWSCLVQIRKLEIKQLSDFSN